MVNLLKGIMDILNFDNTEELGVNTSRRYNAYCNLVSEDGSEKCSLYSPHVGLCKSKNGLEKDRFKGVKPVQS